MLRTRAYIPVPLAAPYYVSDVGDAAAATGREGRWNEREEIVAPLASLPLVT